MSFNYHLTSHYSILTSHWKLGFLTENLIFGEPGEFTFYLVSLAGLRALTGDWILNKRGERREMSGVSGVQY